MLFERCLETLMGNRRLLKTSWNSALGRETMVYGVSSHTKCDRSHMALQVSSSDSPRRYQSRRRPEHNQPARACEPKAMTTAAAAAVTRSQPFSKRPPCPRRRCATVPGPLPEPPDFGSPAVSLTQPPQAQTSTMRGGERSDRDKSAARGRLNGEAREEHKEIRVST